MLLGCPILERYQSYQAYQSSILPGSLQLGGSHSLGYGHAPDLYFQVLTGIDSGASCGSIIKYRRPRQIAVLGWKANRSDPAEPD